MAEPPLWVARVKLAEHLVGGLLVSEQTQIDLLVNVRFPESACGTSRAGLRHPIQYFVGANVNLLELVPAQTVASA